MLERRELRDDKGRIRLTNYDSHDGVIGASEIKKRKRKKSKMKGPRGSVEDNNKGGGNVRSS